MRRLAGIAVALAALAAAAQAEPKGRQRECAVGQPAHGTARAQGHALGVGAAVFWVGHRLDQPPEGVAGQPCADQ